MRVNATAQKVQIVVVKNDGNWLINDIILDRCSVVDTGNWKCTETNGQPGGPIYIVKERGMLRGQYYASLEGGPPLTTTR